MVSKKKPTGLLKGVRLCFVKMFKNKLKSIALASSLFFLVSCAAPIVGKHQGSNVHKQLKTPKKTYAILVSGAFPDVEPTDNYLQDKAVEVYDRLKDLGLSDEDIYFLATRRGEGMENTDNLFTYRTFSNVRKELSTKMTEDDLLIFIYIGHGNKWDDGYAILKNINESSEPKEPDNNFYIQTLEAEVDMLKSSCTIMVVDACKSGYAAKALGKKNRIGISSTCNDQKSWIFSRFVPYLMKALNGEEEADKNNDKKVSLEEAVDYAAKKDPWSKKSFGLGIFFPRPQLYYEKVDPSKVFLKE
ncbi:MAG: caspase family protein [Nanoarchaeota archaeon]|nr:caspase family protein [Nanoarchaeota archaeon]